MKTYHQFLNEATTSRITPFDDSLKLIMGLLQSAELKKLLRGQAISSLKANSEVTTDHGMGRETSVQRFTVNENLNLEVTCVSGTGSQQTQCTVKKI
jgi:hypothetical protein